jgi:uncharacterized protein (TIGR02246 family)
MATGSGKELLWISNGLVAAQFAEENMPAFRLAIMLLLVLTTPSSLDAKLGGDELAIKTIIAEQQNAWNAGDSAGYSRRIAPDVSFTNLFGMVMYGAPAFAERHKTILDTFYKGTTKRHTVRKIRFVTEDVAIVDIDNELRGVTAMPGGIAVPPGGVLRTQLMEVFVRRDNGWWVEAYHNVDVKPAAVK